MLKPTTNELSEKKEIRPNEKGNLKIYNNIFYLLNRTNRTAPKFKFIYFSK